MVRLKQLDIPRSRNTLHWMPALIFCSTQYRRRIWLCVILILLTAAIRAPLLGIPLERDEGEYAYIGWRLEHHELPYRDWVDQKPPAIFWLYRFAFYLPLNPVIAAHLMALLFSAASACALFFLALRFAGTFWAFIAAVLFVLLSSDPLLYGTAANTELFMLLPLILSTLAFFSAASGGASVPASRCDELGGASRDASLPASRGREISFIVLAGILTGIAAAFKQVAAINWPFLFLTYPFFANGRKSLLRISKAMAQCPLHHESEGQSGTTPRVFPLTLNPSPPEGRGKHSPPQSLSPTGEREGPFQQMFFFAAWSLAGIAMVWAAILAFFAVHHALGDFIYNVFTHNLEYVQGVSWSRRLGYLGQTLGSLIKDEWLVWIFCILGLGSLFIRGQKKELIFLLAWLAASAIGVSASGYFFPHYFQQMLPVLCLTAALGAEARDHPAFVIRRVWLCRTIFAAALTVPVIVVLWPFLFSYTPAQAVDKIYPDSHFAEKQKLAECLAQVTSPDDKVFIFGADAEILFYAQRVSATRYIFLFPLYGPYSDAKAKQIAAANEIARNKPAAAVYLPNQLFFAPGSEQFFTQWTQAYLTQNFRVDSCLAFNKSGAVEVVTDLPRQKASTTDGLRVFGELDVRKAKPIGE